MKDKTERRSMMEQGKRLIYNLGCRIGYELACKYLKSKEPGWDLSRMARDKRGQARKAEAGAAGRGHSEAHPLTKL